MLGIGPNRLDTVEESVIFKQQVSLFSAKDASVHNTARPRSSSVGPGVNVTGMQDDVDWSQMPSNSSSSSPQLPHHQDRSPSEDRRSPKIPKSLGKTAAKAGSAILPPTFMREIQASKQQTTSRSPGVSPSASPRHSVGQSSRNGSNRLPHEAGREGYFDPPPVYDASPDRDTFLAAETTSLSISRSNDSARSPEIPTSSSSPIISNVPHPQSVNAAGPGHRSILHPAGRTRSRESPQNSPVVRFDPQAVNTALQRSTEDISPDSNGTSAGRQMTVNSEPGSRRTSFDGSRSTFSTSVHSQNKGKARMNSPSPGATARKGIKGLLGNLLKEDDEERRKAEAQLSTIDDEANHFDYREFKKGTYNYPFSIPLPSNLPPTLHADFGSNAYIMKAHVQRSGPLTSNLSEEREIILVHAPDEDGQDEVESIIVERSWEDSLRYLVVVTGKSFPVGGRIPIFVKFVPTDKIKIHRIIASLEERTAYYAKGRRVARHEVPRRWTLLKLLPKNNDAGILPINADDPQSLDNNPLTSLARAAAASYSETADVDISASIASLLDPAGPWELVMELEIPKHASTRINITSNHNKSNIAVTHLVKLAIRVERLQTGSQRKLYDILIDAPVSINHSHTANAWLSLPDYWSVSNGNDGDVPQSTIELGTAPNPYSSHRSSSVGPTPNSSPSTSSSSNHQRTHNQPAARTRTQLNQLSRQWLSLSEAARNSNTSGSGRATVTYQESFLSDEDELRGQNRHTLHDHASDLPTYAMIDNARGSVDPPPNHRQIK